MINKPLIYFIILGICFIWVGAIIGVSFIATPAKFAAKSAQLPQLLDVGRHTFSYFNKVEWVFLFAIIISFKVLNFPYFILVIIIAILMSQSIFLLPELYIRAQAVIDGTPKNKSLHHLIYGILEVSKLIFLLFLCYKIRLP